MDYLNKVNELVSGFISISQIEEFIIELKSIRMTGRKREDGAESLLSQYNGQLANYERSSSVVDIVPEAFYPVSGPSEFCRTGNHLELHS